MILVARLVLEMQVKDSKYFLKDTLVKADMNSDNCKHFREIRDECAIEALCFLDLSFSDVTTLFATGGDTFARIVLWLAALKFERLKLFRFLLAYESSSEHLVSWAVLSVELIDAPVYCLENGLEDALAHCQVELAVVNPVYDFICSRPVVHSDTHLEQLQFFTSVQALARHDDLLMPQVDLLLFHLAFEALGVHDGLEHESVKVLQALSLPLHQLLDLIFAIGLMTLVLAERVPQVRPHCFERADLVLDHECDHAQKVVLILVPVRLKICLVSLEEEDGCSQALHVKVIYEPHKHAILAVVQLYQDAEHEVKHPAHVKFVECYQRVHLMLDFLKNLLRQLAATLVAGSFGKLDRELCVAFGLFAEQIELEKAGKVENVYPVERFPQDFLVVIPANFSHNRRMQHFVRLKQVCQLLTDDVIDEALQVRARPCILWLRENLADVFAVASELDAAKVDCFKDAQAKLFILSGSLERPSYLLEFVFVRFQLCDQAIELHFWLLLVGLDEEALNLGQDSATYRVVNAHLVPLVLLALLLGTLLVLFV